LKKLAQAKGSIRRGDSNNEDSRSFDEHSSNHRAGSSQMRIRLGGEVGDSDVLSEDAAPKQTATETRLRAENN
jgi:hypothetical protein